MSKRKEYKVLVPLTIRDLKQIQRSLNIDSIYLPTSQRHYIRGLRKRINNHETLNLKAIQNNFKD